MPHIHTLERQMWQITIADLQATFLHFVATHCNRIFYQLFLCVICKFSLRISMNYKKNVAEQLAPVRTVDTRCSSVTFVEHLGMRLLYVVT